MAVAENKINSVETLLDLEDDIESTASSRINKGCTPLHVATESGHLDMVKLLVHRGAILRSRDEIGRTPLMLAVIYARTDILKFYLQMDSTLIEEDVDGWTPLNLTIKDQKKKINLKTIELLLEKGADPEVEFPGTGLKPLHIIAACENPNPDVLRLLLKYKADPNSSATDGSRPLHSLANGEGIRFENVEKLGVELLVQHKADINAKDKNGATPLHIAVSRSRISMVRLLLKHGANPKAQDNEGKEPSNYLTRDPSSIDILALLLDTSKVGTIPRQVQLELENLNLQKKPEGQSLQKSLDDAEIKQLPQQEQNLSQNRSKESDTSNMENRREQKSRNHTAHKDKQQWRGSTQGM
ncbi:Ankyrin-1 [Dactylellina cionopaga]|nr:Ankyrin-1 [Dactylellina cionopaga]